ncbi:FAD-dependent oxidoreductase [Roseomonas sp. OT10]|uniref:FAD-dependent oxidoreductase n=1 Tax=Roseomonas cutis TaxID=2897332 RepID=UPI001E4BCDF9|nr:FAD-dependent oxidoreductase [Roseomonas sp. OT10]UFN49290.1 FAD-dependent oxidoreductase [Roseomonas sp. OT10]
MTRSPSPAAFPIRVDGETLRAEPGETLAATLVAHGLVAQATGADGAPRGAFCGMGVCHDCLVSVDGRLGQRACLTTAEPGMEVRRFAAARPALEGQAALSGLPPGPLPLREAEVVVVGAGPGGLAAALMAAQAGLGVLVLDERPKPGGQFYKQPAGGGGDRQARDGAALIAAALAAGAAIESETLVWGAFRPEGEPEGGLELGLLRRGQASRLRCRWLVVATGAYERPQIVPGWTLPGVMTTGACQTLLRSHGVLPGQRVLFAGNGPLHLQVAAEVLRAGGAVAAVAEAGRPLSRPAAGWAMVRAQPRLAMQGLGLVGRLRRSGVPLLWGHGLRRLEGAERVERAVLAPLDARGGFVAGRDVTVEADAVCLGVGFAPASELPRLLGCAHAVPPGQSHAEVVRNESGATSLPDVFVVGEAGGFGGAHVALAQGRLAGATIAHRAGRSRPRGGDAGQALARARRFQSALWAAFAAPPPAFPAEEETLLCRCEGLSLGRLRAVAEREGVRDVATLKRLTRAGMGRCQGRYCGAHLARVIGAPPGGEADLLAPQMPLRPVPLPALAVEKPEWGGHRRALLPPDRTTEGPPLPVHEAATVVIGAGIAGLSTALFLARAGHDVVVLEAGRPNAMASGGNAGSLHVQLLSFDYGAKAEAGGSPAARTLPLQRDSVALWEALERETGRDFEIKRTGGLMVAETERDLRFLDAKTAVERSMGIECGVIDAASLYRLEPHLAPGLLGAAYCPQEGKINPLVATQGILDAALAAGARVFDRTSLRAVERRDGRFLLHTSRGTLLAGRLVNAAGAFASRVGDMLGHRVPVFGAPLQMVVTEAVAPMVSALVAHADRHLTLKQAGNGNFLIGGGWTATLDPVHHRPRPLRESLEGNLWVAQRVVPALQRLHVLRSWAAMNINIDGAPILGEHPAEPGFFNAVSSNGYTLGPMLGQVTARLILRGDAGRDLSAFSIARFG